MKSKHVQRSITNYTKRAPRKELGKMTRLRKAEIDDNDANEMSPQKMQQSSAFQNRLKHILSFFGIIGCAGLGYVIFDSTQNAKQKVAFVSEEEDVLKIQHPKKEEAKELIQRFFEATELYQWNDLIRDDLDEATLAFSKFSSMIREGWKVKKMEHIGPRQASIGFVNSTICVDNYGATHIIDLVHDGAKWKIDASAALQMHSKDWLDFFEEKSTHGIVRISLSDEERYYNGVYSDEGLWQCFKLVDSPKDPPITGYVKRHTACHVAILKMLKEASFQKCILEIHRDVKAENSQYEIEKVISPDWIKTDKIYSDLYLDQADAERTVSQEK